MHQFYIKKSRIMRTRKKTAEEIRNWKNMNSSTAKRLGNREFWHGTLQRQNTENLKQIFSESEFPHSCVCERFIYSHHRSALSATGIYVNQSWEYTNRSHECGNWNWGCAIPFLGINKWDFCCSAEAEAKRKYRFIVDVCSKIGFF